MTGRLTEAASAGAEAGGSIVPDLAKAAAAAGAPPVQPSAPEQQAAAGPPEQMPPGAPAPGPAQQSPAATGPAGAGPAAPSSAPGGAPELPEEPASPEEQQEYDRVMGGVAKVLYGNDNTANSIVDQIDVNDKIGSTAKVAMLFIRELDRKMNMRNAVVAPVTQEVVARMVELSEARHGVQYEPTEEEKILGAAWEGVSAMFANESGPEGAQQFQSFVSQFDADTLSKVKQQHEAALNG